MSPHRLCIHRRRWASSWERTSSSTKKWCTATWTSWISVAGTLSPHLGCSWKASGCQGRPRRSTGWWRSLLLGTWSVTRGKSHCFLLLSRVAVNIFVLDRFTSVYFWSLHLNRTEQPLNVVVCPPLQTNSVCQCRHCIRAGILYHYAHHRPA